MCCMCVQMCCVRMCWCADADDCKKEKRKVTERKKRKENLLNTNPGAQICMQTCHMGVQMWVDADGVDVDGVDADSGGGE